MSNPDIPKVVALAEDGTWWKRAGEDRLGWWWELISPQPNGFIVGPRRFSELPKVVETYHTSAAIAKIVSGVS